MGVSDQPNWRRFSGPVSFGEERNSDIALVVSRRVSHIPNDEFEILFSSLCFDFLLLFLLPSSPFSSLFRPSSLRQPLTSAFSLSCSSSIFPLSPPLSLSPFFYLFFFLSSQRCRVSVHLYGRYLRDEDEGNFLRPRCSENLLLHLHWRHSSRGAGSSSFSFFSTDKPPPPSPPPPPPPPPPL